MPETGCLPIKLYLTTAKLVFNSLDPFFEDILLSSEDSYFIQLLCRCWLGFSGSFPLVSAFEFCTF